MNIIIDTKLLNELNLNINEYLTLYKIYLLQNKLDSIEFFSDVKWLDSLETKGFIIRHESKIKLLEHSIALFVSKVDKLDELVDKLKELYPKGKKNGQYYWFGNKPEIKTKLKSFLNKYKTVSYEEVYKATERYINTFNEYNRDSGMMLLKYFIAKDNTSTLLTEIENLDSINEKEVDSYEKDL